MKNRVLLAFSFIFVLAVLACGTDDSKVETQASSDNPFKYCKAVGTIDKPDARYTGKRVTYNIAEQLKEEFGASESMPNDLFMEGTYWRCMDGSVYACNVGNNLPCQEKADTSKKPNEGMINYCKENTDAEFIPAFAQGRTTVYEWKCKGGEPEVVKQIVDTDAAGYQKNIWYKIKPPEDLSQKDVLRE